MSDPLQIGGFVKMIGGVAIDTLAAGLTPFSKTLPNKFAEARKSAWEGVVNKMTMAPANTQQPSMKLQP